MNKERAIYFAGLMEEYLNIPSCVCENIENELINEKYNKVINYVIDRRKELENKSNYKTHQKIINMYLKLQQENQKYKEKYENAVADYETTMFEKEQLNSLVNSCQEEIRQLKKQLEEWENHLKCSKEMLDIQGQKGNYDYDEYMLGLYNGMKYIIALFETREPIFKSGKDIEFISDKTQQKEFINWLIENESLDDYCNETTFTYIREKYEEIIGDKE